MALRVARGLFRLWLVLVVLCIGGVGVVTWGTFPAEDPVRASVTFRLTSDLKLGTARGLDGSKNSWARNKRAAIQHSILLAFVPPAFVLALGSVLVWAFRGFR
jgi:hypothetical protein